MMMAFFPPSKNAHWRPGFHHFFIFFYTCTKGLHIPVLMHILFFFNQTGPIVCICNSINLIMSAHSPVAHYRKWFMGFIRANLPQHLVPLLVHGCDACLSLTELMLLLLSMCMHPSFSVFVLGWLNPGDSASTVGHYCHCRLHSELSAPFLLVNHSSLALTLPGKITCVGNFKINRIPLMLLHRSWVKFCVDCILKRLKRVVV